MYTGKNQGKDFAIHCKIVKPTKDIDNCKGNQKEKEVDYQNKFDTFVSEIAEASNSQKPINDRDLKANAPEQKKLKKLLADKEPIIHLEIKRGENKPPKIVPKYLQIKNDFYGQLFLSFVLQNPGTARNDKKKVFSSNKFYEKIFNIEPNDNLKDMLYDLCRLHNHYKDYLNGEETSKHFEKFPVFSTVATKGTFFVIATIGFILKYYRNKDGFQNFLQSSELDKWNEIISKHDIIEKFYPDKLTDNYEKSLNSLFQKIIKLLVKHFESDKYKAKMESKFLKSDSPYITEILPDIRDILLDPDEEAWRKGIKKCFKI